jgi:hypothetical protein
LKDITLIGCTAWNEPVFPNLVSYIEKVEIKPLLERTFPLENIVDAQKMFSVYSPIFAPRDVIISSAGHDWASIFRRFLRITR